MFAIRLAKYNKNFIRRDGLCSDNRASARLFDSVDEARAYIVDWRTGTAVSGGSTIPLEIVEVETKPVMQRVICTVELV